MLSNRADLVSGGDALVRVTVPRGVKAKRVKLFAGRRNVTKQLERTGRRRLRASSADCGTGERGSSRGSATVAPRASS